MLIKAIFTKTEVEFVASRPAVHEMLEKVSLGWR